MLGLTMRRSLWGIGVGRCFGLRRLRHALHFVKESIGIIRPLLGLDGGYFARVDEHGERSLHGNHPLAGHVFDLGLKLGVYLLGLPQADEVAPRRRCC